MTLSSGSTLVTREQLQSFRDALSAGPVVILTHSNPDPDALASGAGLACLITEVWGIKTQLAYSGLVGRAENKVMMEVLTPGWKPLDEVENISSFPCYVLVDTQPGAGNNNLPLAVMPCAVIDHHPVLKNVDNIPYVDVRTEFGATSSIVYQYLEAAGYQPDAKLATALFYGIQTDTQGLSRGSSATDRDIYFKLLGLIDRDKLVEVIQAGVPREYFQAFYTGLRSSRVYQRVIISYLGAVHRPDFPAELADFLIRLEGVHAVLCMGYHGNILYLSLRTKEGNEDAGRLIQKIVAPHGTAGGHGSYAGGQIPIANGIPDEIAAKVQRKFLDIMHENGNGESLLSTV